MYEPSVFLSFFLSFFLSLLLFPSLTKPATLGRTLLDAFSVHDQDFEDSSGVRVHKESGNVKRETYETGKRKMKRQ